MSIIIIIIYYINKKINEPFIWYDLSDYQILIKQNKNGNLARRIYYNRRIKDPYYYVNDDSIAFKFTAYYNIVMKLKFRLSTPCSVSVACDIGADTIATFPSELGDNEQIVSINYTKYIPHNTVMYFVVSFNNPLDFDKDDDFEYSILHGSYMQIRQL